MRRTESYKSGAETLHAGNYEWPFEWIIPGNSLESLEGMMETWVIYRLKATIERSVLQQNVVARRQVRVIRTPNLTDLELFHAMVCTLSQYIYSSLLQMVFQRFVSLGKIDDCETLLQMSERTREEN